MICGLFFADLGYYLQRSNRLYITFSQFSYVCCTLCQVIARTGPGGLEARSTQ